MTDALVEAVARAIYAQWPNQYKQRRPTTMTSPAYEIVTLAETWEEMCDNTPSRKIECIDAARAALAAIEQSGTHVVAPVEPTHEMLEAGWRAMFETVPDDNGPVIIGAGYDAMLSARPKQEDAS